MNKCKLLVCLAAGLLFLAPVRAQAQEILHHTTYAEYDAACQQMIHSGTEYVRLLVKTTGDFAVSDFTADVIVGGPDNHFMLFYRQSDRAEAALAVLASHSEIEYAEADALETLEPLEEEERALLAAASQTSYHSWGVTNIGADQYAEYVLQSTTPAAVKVAVIDTGVMAEHSCFAESNLIMGHDYVDGDEEPQDENGHGTRVTGILVDCMGELPVDVLVLRTMDAEGNGYVSNITAAIRSAADQGAKLINLSLGGKHSTSNSKEEAIAYAVSKGAMVVVASGNHSSSIEDYNGCPAHIESAVIVGAVSKSETYATYGDYGPTVDFAAPGSAIDSPNLTGSYSTQSGTSMATPHVTALAAMLWEKYPSYTATQIENLLISSCRDLGAEGKDDYYGYGIPDLRELLGYYTITYGGTGTEIPTAQKEVRFVSATLSEKEPSRIGWIFLGWNTNPNATTALYQPGQEVHFAQDVTLYAIWREPGTVLTTFPSTYPVTIEKPGEVVYYQFIAPKDAYYIFESTSSVDTKVRILSNDGTELCEDDDSGTDRNFLLKAEMTGGESYFIEVSLYGTAVGSLTMKVSRKQKWTIRYLFENGEEIYETGMYEEGEQAVLSDLVPDSVNGRYFLGWTAVKGGTASYLPGGKYNLSGNFALYAVWAEAKNLGTALPLQTTVEIPFSKGVVMCKYTPKDSGIYTFSSISREGDPKAVLYNDSFQMLAVGDDYNNTYNFSFRYELTAGKTYYLLCTQSRENLTGSFQVRIERAEVAKIVKQPSNLTVTAGETASFAVEAEGEGLTYQWQKSFDGRSWGKMSSPGATTSKVSFTAKISMDQMQVRCLVMDRYGKQYIGDAVRLEVKPALTITKQPTDLTVGAGKAATFTVSISGTVAGFQWQKSFDGSRWANLSATSAKTNTVTFYPSMSFDGMQLRCVITTETGTQLTSGAAVLTVVDKPRFTVEPQNQRVGEGKRVSFYATAEGEDLTYRWQKSFDGSKWVNFQVSSSKTETVSFVAAANMDGMQVRCVATDCYGNKTIGKAATLDVVLKPVITENPQDVTVAPGTVVNFHTEASGEGLTYQWQKTYDGTKWVKMSATSATTDTVTFTASKSTDGMLVRCVVVDTCGTKVTGAAAAVHIEK